MVRSPPPPFLLTFLLTLWLRFPIRWQEDPFPGKAGSGAGTTRAAVLQQLAAPSLEAASAREVT